MLGEPYFETKFHYDTHTINSHFTLETGTNVQGGCRRLPYFAVFTGSVSAEGAVACSACAAGDYSEAGVTCKSCQEYDTNTNSTFAASGPESCHCIAGFSGIVGACLACEAGKFKPDIGTQTCQDRVDLQFQALKGASSCSICPAAHVRANSKTCTACSRGKYKTTAGSRTCITCEEPLFTDQVASLSCDMCGAGSDCADAHTCRVCALGKYTGHAGQSRSLERAILQRCSHM